MGLTPSIPVSCFALRIAASKNVSPFRSLPPGSHQTPLTGSDARSTSKHSFRAVAGLYLTIKQSVHTITQSLTRRPYRSAARNLRDGVMVVNSDRSPQKRDKSLPSRVAPECGECFEGRFFRVNEKAEATATPARKERINGTFGVLIVAKCQTSNEKAFDL